MVFIVFLAQTIRTTTQHSHFKNVIGIYFTFPHCMTWLNFDISSSLFLSFISAQEDENFHAVLSLSRIIYNPKKIALYNFYCRSTPRTLPLFMFVLINFFCWLFMTFLCRLITWKTNGDRIQELRIVWR